MKEELFKEVFKLPFRFAIGTENTFVLDYNNNLVIQFKSLKKDFISNEEVLELINNPNITIKKKLPELFHNYGSIFYKEESNIKIFISMRGLGYMTGFLNKSYEYAYDVQDSLAEYITNKLNKL